MPRTGDGSVHLNVHRIFSPWHQSTLKVSSQKYGLASAFCLALFSFLGLTRDFYLTNDERLLSPYRSQHLFLVLSSVSFQVHYLKLWLRLLSASLPLWFQYILVHSWDNPISFQEGQFDFGLLFQRIHFKSVGPVYLSCSGSASWWQRLVEEHCPLYRNHKRKKDIRRCQHPIFPPGILPQGPYLTPPREGSTISQKIILRVKVLRMGFWGTV